MSTIENLRFLKADSDRLFVGTQGNLIEIMPDNGLRSIKENSYLYKITDVIIDGNTYWVNRWNKKSSKN